MLLDVNLLERVSKYSRIVSISPRVKYWGGVHLIYIYIYIYIHLYHIYLYTIYIIYIYICIYVYIVIDSISAVVYIVYI